MTTTAPVPSGSVPAPARVLGDGTVAVPGTKGELRLSESRTRWWNGRIWVPVAESTPWDALVEGDRWWDGAEWIPVRTRLAAILRPIPLSALQLGVPVLVLVLFSILLGSTAGILFFLIVHLGLYFGLTISSKAMPNTWRSAWFFSLAGLAYVLVRVGLRRAAGARAEDSGGAPARA